MSNNAIFDALFPGVGTPVGDEGATLFAPANKYSPLKMLPTDGWANGNDDSTATAATHDASAGAAPSYTTAKKRSIAIVTVAGSINGIVVAVGDLLMALQDNPTTVAHWSVIKDCTTEFSAAVVAAQGSPVEMIGTFLLQTANPDAAINLTGDFTILNRCGYPAIYQTANNTRAALQTPRQVSAAGAGVAVGLDVDDEVGTTLQQVTYFTLTTAASNFKLNQMVEVFTDAVHVSEAGSSKGYISNAFKVTSIDLVGGVIYADRVVKYHNRIANATNIYLIPLHEDRAIHIREGALFMGAPTIIGGEVGWWQTLDGSTFLAGTISGSGSSRVVSYTGVNLNYLVGQGVRIGTVSGTPERSCKITAFSYSSGVNTITVEMSTTDDKGHVYSAPTSGTIYFNPVWWTTEFDSTTHGGAVVVQQAHGSKIKCEIARMWSMAIRLRFSHFCEVDVTPSKIVNIGTGISGRSWRLTYDVEDYSSSRSKIRVRSGGPGGRHPYTGSTGTTSTAWASTHWQFRSGCSCESDVWVETEGDTGPTGDTHAMQNGTKIVSKSRFPTTYNTAHSYRGIGHQRRCENGITIHEQQGGQIGMRIANGSSYLRGAGSIDDIDLTVNDLPLRSDAHAFASGGSAGNLPAGLIIQSQAAYTGGAAGDKTLVIGKMRFKDAACGFNFEASTKGRFDSISHQDVGYAGGWIQTGASVYAKEVSLDYSIAGGVETTSVSSVSLAAGSKTFTVDTGLVISSGARVLIQDATSVANSKAKYGWGRVVSYDSGTGVLVVYLEGVKSSGTIASWTITIGAKIPRYGVVLSGTGEFTFGRMEWKVGEGANPTEIFHSKDSTGGKVVTGGMIIIDDPLSKGMPNIVTAGREADFTLNIGIIIYNGVVIFKKGILTTGRISGETMKLCARDIDGAVETPFITLTAGNTPTCDLDAAVTKQGLGIANQITYQELTADGNAVAPAWFSATSRVYVEIGAGGGGGGGGARVVATGSGGAGGGGGNMQYRTFRGSDITFPVTCTVGAGGSGGAGATSDGNPGSNGVAGGNSTFGTYLNAFGGGYGSGGQIATNSGGGGGGGYTAAGANGASGAGGAGGTGAGGNGGNGAAGSSNLSGSLGGCGGSGCPVATGVGIVGGSGAWAPAGGSSGGGVLTGTFKAGGDGAYGAGYYSGAPAGGSTAGAAGADATGLSRILNGLSGGAGAGNSAGVGGAGGAGGGFSAGGSGGGAAIGGNGGAGAAGRNGIIRVWIYA